MTSLRSTRLGCFLGIAIGSVYAFFANFALAQITPDPTLPNNSNVTTEGNTFNITGGSQAGSNLFHSFQEFSVPANSTALFNNATDIQNILTRVTGGSISNIDGLIKANGTANLFLINPNGIVFGQNARLDIGGSFLASTASSLKFADGTDFSTTPNLTTTPLLSINVPIGLQYGSNTGSIQVQGANLQVIPGTTLALAGGNVEINGGQLLAAGGRIELAGMAEQGSIGLNSNGLNLALNFPDVGLRKDVSISNGAQVNVLAGGGGIIAISAQNLNILGESTVQAGIDSGKGSVDAKAFDIDVNATQAINVDASRIFNTVQSNAVGNSGNINITTGSLALTNGTQVRTTTFGQGNAGNINIIARDRVFMVDTTYVRSEVRESAEGNGGDINISTGFLDLRNGAELIATNFGGKGDAGNVNIVARDTISFDGTDSEGFPSGAFSNLLNNSVGNGGDINISTGSLYLTNGAELVATNFGGKGDAGNVNIVARDTISFDGRGRGGFPSGAFSNVLARGVGNGGEINITTGSLSVSNGAVLNAFTSGKGNAGRVNIVARDTITFDNGRALSSVQPTGVGNGGGIKITTNSISITNEGELRATNLGQGNAGDIQVNSSSIRLDNQAGIRSRTTSGDGGNISLEVRDLLLLRRGSEISTTAGTAQAGGNGGNITINTPRGFIVAAPSENSDITANAFSGTGGRVTINATNIFGIAPLSRQDLEKLLPNDLDPAQLPTNDITAISQQNPSLSGTVQINTPDVDPSRGLVQLRANLVDASQQIATGCNGGENQARSSFIVTGRGGIPPSPTEPLISDGVVTNWITLFDATEEQERSALEEQDATDSANPPDRIVEAQGWVVDANGEVILVDAAPTVALHNPLFQPVSCSAIEPR